MPHLVMLYTNNLEAEADIARLCRSLADALIAQRDDAGQPVFPRGGTRVFAYPSTHHAVSDGSVAGRAIGESGDYGFVYVNLRMGGGRSDVVKKQVGDALLAVVDQHVEPLLARHRIGITLQIDESPGQVYDGKLGNLHALFG